MNTNQPNVLDRSAVVSDPPVKPMPNARGGNTEADGEGLQFANAMSVDVEDYFQVSAFESVIDRADWGSHECRIPRNIDRILQLFDETGTKATFFTLGWVCRAYPDIVRSISDAGHEIASHGCDHARVWTMDEKQFLSDVSDSRKRLEDTTGSPVLGYRAPSFSIDGRTEWAYRMLAEAGYRYSSSVYPIQHDHYGIPDAPRGPHPVDGLDSFLEIPLSTIRAFGRNWPCAGGGYFRLLPLMYSIRAIRRLNTSESVPAVFYFHPWEMDPGQPRVAGVSRRARFRHYVNLSKFESRLRHLTTEFCWDRMDSIFLVND